MFLDLFCFLWVLVFIIACNVLVVIGLIENYCFTKEKMDQEHHGLFIIDFLNPMVELCLQLSLDLLLLSL